MSSPKLAEVTLPDGSKAYVMSQEQMAALAQVAENHIWMEQTTIRAKRVSIAAGMVIGLLMFLASLWPHLIRWIRLLFPDGPT